MKGIMPWFASEDYERCMRYAKGEKKVGIQKLGC
jgi:hypothetical protein